MTHFQHFQDFFGAYVGSYDGRRARLELRDVKGDSPWPMCHLTFTELERNEVYVGTHVHKGPRDHIMSDIVLKQQSGGGEVTWSRLHLHTWDTSHLSGVSTWNGIEFGMSFARVND
jgi:hypothetical protein